MNTTDQAALPPPIRDFIASLEATGATVNVHRLEIDPMPARESTAPFADPLPPASLLQQANRILEAKLMGANKWKYELDDLLIAHGFKPGEDILGAIRKVLDYWDTRPSDKAPENPGAPGGAPASAGKQPAPAPEIPADRHLRAGFPAFRTADIQAHPFRTLGDVARSLSANLNGKPIFREEVRDRLDSPPSQAQPRKNRPATYTIPALCWRYGRTPGELRGYLDQEPGNTLFIITRNGEGAGGYRMDGITRHDGAKSPRYASIMAAQDDAQAQLNGWVLRHFLSREGNHTTTAASTN